MLFPLYRRTSRKRQSKNPDNPALLGTSGSRTGCPGTTRKWHGITSVVIGNCGFGFAPVRPAERERAMMSMTRVEAIPMASMKQGMPWSWVTFPEFLDSVDRTPKAVNILPYVPLSPLLIWVMGFEAAKAGKMPTPE